MSNNTPSLHFSIPLDASSATVDALVAAIRRTFPSPAGAAPVRDVSGDVAPESLAADQQPPQNQDTNAGPLVEGTDEAGPRDAFGWPWNSQIHAGTKNTTGNGAWRSRSRVPEDKRKAVVAAMIEAYGLTDPGADEGGDEGGDAGKTPQQAPAGGPPKPPAPPAPPSPPASQTPTAAPEFTNYTSWLATAQAENPGLTDEWLASVYQHYGATDSNGGGSLAKLAELDPDTINECADYVKATHAQMMGG